MDLVNMGKYRSHNDGYYWILTVVEILSRLMFAVPVKNEEYKKYDGRKGYRQISQHFRMVPKLLKIFFVR